MHTLVQLRRRPAPTPFRPVQARAAQPAVRSAVQPGGGPAARAGGRDAALLQLQRTLGNRALRQVLQPAVRGPQDVIRRDLVEDAARNFTGFAFRIGQELDLAWVELARRQTRSGPLAAGGIVKLKEAAIAARETVSDHERMFLAALLDAANVRRLQAARIGPTTRLTFALTTITPARIQQVIAAGQAALSPAVAGPSAKAAQAFAQLDFTTGVKEMQKSETAAEGQARTLAGTGYRSQIDAVLVYARANGLLVTNVLGAMLRAASDNSAADRVFAAAAYAVAAAAGQPLAQDIHAGRIHVDALGPAAFARLPGVGARFNALYIAAAPINPQIAGLKGDTIYLQTGFDINNLYDRSVVIHELQHATEDKAASATGKPGFVPQQEAEERAYRAQAHYLLGQLEAARARAQAAGTRAGGPAASQAAAQAATQTAGGGDLVLLPMLLAAQRDRARYEPLLVQVFAAASPPAQRNAAGVAALLAVPAARLEAVFQQAILTGYGITSTSPALLEGQAGESIIHWIFRL